MPTLAGDESADRIGLVGSPLPRPASRRGS
jgi:hypothetical protein